VVIERGERLAELGVIHGGATMLARVEDRDEPWPRGVRSATAPDDLILVLMANDGIHTTSPAARVAASRRFAALAIQAFQVSPAASPMPSMHV
jgi:hypothetical protein